MPERPQPIDDPYGTLGLAPGASAAEIKRAYRQLAKEFHPDSAGEATLPRFLAIHEAYERLRTGRVIGGVRTSRAPTPPPAEPWRADPARARAARERARAGRGTGPGAGARGTAPSAGGTRGAPGAGADPAGGSRGRAGGTTGAGARATGTTGASGSGRPRRSTRKATLGSTSYDEARDPNDPAWSGAAWYGPSSGEYWIINPREYADPRKHGPEYQQRARRLAAGGVDETTLATEATTAGAGAEPIARREASSSTSGAAWTIDDEPSREATGDRPVRRGRGVQPDAAVRPGAAARPDRARRWEQRDEPARASAAATAGQEAQRAATWNSRATPGEAGSRAGMFGALGTSPRELVGGAADDPIRRLGIALVAWPPVGLAAAALIGDVTGCSTYSAACGGTEPLLPWLAQAGILGLLLLLPPIARLLAGGSIAVLIALLPISALLLAAGGSGEPEAAFSMWFLLGVAWLVGIAWSAMELRRRRGSAGSPAGPARDPMRGAS
ncbi:MAG TPA: J domain-containing protein [Candidatus Limnocylindria bacterium]|nr:J domain-containing protein [Candidatus Limnocylindria bacterium]